MKRHDVFLGIAMMCLSGCEMLQYVKVSDVLSPVILSESRTANGFPLRHFQHVQDFEYLQGENPPTLNDNFTQC